MDGFISYFVREGEGAWACVKPATLDFGNGRIQVTPGTRLRRGTKYMGVDLARLLDEHYEKARRQG